MSLKITQTSSNQSSAAVPDYTVLGQTSFFNKFAWGKAVVIGTDEEGYVDIDAEHQSITSFEIGDCITIFAIEKENNENISLAAWHISDGSSVDDLVGELEGSDYTNSYDIYIIGGNSGTTEGKDCLLDNMYAAIEQVFTGGYTIELELTNLEKTTGRNFVSANLNLDGTLNLCYHN